MSLHISELHKSYSQGSQKVEVLKHLNLETSLGEVVAIVGPSGSGKSTLLSILAGIDRPDAGVIQIGSVNLFQMKEPERVHFRGTQIGIIFQQFHLMSHLSALENVMLPLEISRGTDIKNKAHLILERVGLADRKNHRPHQLSGGECQRVAIARALVIEPSLLLADEPSGSLDEETGSKVIDLLFSTLRERQVTSLFVTHSFELAKKCDRILKMQAGQLSLHKTSETP